jgi:cysteine synthase A
MSVPEPEIGDTMRVRTFDERLRESTFASGRGRLGSREWVDEAVRRIDADANRSADTHLHVFPLRAEWGIDLYLKDESVHPTGSLKHRLARSLFLYGLCNGWITERTTIVEASSGSTAVSESYFARLLGLPFVAVLPAVTSPAKIALIEAQGGLCHLVDDPSTTVNEAQRLAAESGGHFIDQFTYAERAMDWRSNNNIAESVFAQMTLERHPVPAWVVVGAGTGGTSATIGRYLRFGGYHTRLCVVDPEDSIFYPSWTGDLSAFTGRPSRIEGIGRQRLEPSFLPGLVDRMIQVPDAASIATMRLVRARTGRSVGGSTGTNVWGALQLIAEMLSRGERGSVVTLICDGGNLYAGTYYSDTWVSDQGIELAPYREALETFLESGAFPVAGSAP